MGNNELREVNRRCDPEPGENAPPLMLARYALLDNSDDLPFDEDARSIVSTQPPAELARAN